MSSAAVVIGPLRVKRFKGANIKLATTGTKSVSFPIQGVIEQQLHIINNVFIHCGFH